MSKETVSVGSELLIDNMSVRAIPALSFPSNKDACAEPIRVLAFIEALSLTGPAKNLIEFARLAALPDQSIRANIGIVTFQRITSAKSLTSNRFILACQQLGLDVYVIQERCLFDPAVIPAIRQLIASHNPQILQTHAVKSHFLMYLSGLGRKHHWIAFHHGYTWPNMKVRAYNQLDRLSLPSAARVVTVCRSFAYGLQDIGVRPERITIRHNSVKPFIPVRKDQVIPLRRTLGIPEGAQILLSVGRLSREKGQKDLIQALAICRRGSHGRDLRIVFVGDGPDRQALSETAKEFRVADQVVFAGYQPDPAPYYLMADLMVLSSHMEGSPNALLEAMAAGLPIIATAVGGVPEIVTNSEEALLVEKGNPVELSRAIERVLGDGGLRRELSHRAHTKSLAYSSTAYCESMLALYRDVLARNVTQTNRKKPQ